MLLISMQGSSKLEKAEILQMTVDHLKLLHAMGGKGEISEFVATSFVFWNMDTKGPLE